MSFESQQIAKGFRMSKAEFRFFEEDGAQKDSSQYMRLEIHWFQIATTITDGFPSSGIIPTAYCIPRPK